MSDQDTPTPFEKELRKAMKEVQRIADAPDAIRADQLQALERIARYTLQLWDEIVYER